MELNQVCVCPSWFLHELLSFPPASDVSSFSSSTNSVIPSPASSEHHDVSKKQDRQPGMLILDELHCSFQVTSLCGFEFPHPLPPILSSLYTLSFLHPHFHLLSPFLFLPPWCLIWLKELKGNCSSHRTGFAPCEHPGPPKAAATLRGHGQSPLENSGVGGFKSPDPGNRFLGFKSLLPSLLVMWPWARNNLTEVPHWIELSLPSFITWGWQ